MRLNGHHTLGVGGIVIGGGNVYSNFKRLKTGKPQQPQHGLQNSCSIVSTALHCPYYWQHHPKLPVTCVLRVADPALRNDKSFVLDAVSVSGYELQFSEQIVRGDKTIVAWAGAPVGASKT
jgi:hypothetical protein